MRRDLFDGPQRAQPGQPGGAAQRGSETQKLTDMEREEAVNNLKKVLGFSPTYDEAFYTLFPEFKEESEDERTRKGIIELLKEIEQDDTYCGLWHIKFMIAYLEKQKEQNLIMAKSPQLKDQELEGVQGDKGTPGLAGIEAVDGVVHHVMNAHYIVTNQKQLNARLREIPEGTKVKILICEIKEESYDTDS